MDGTRHGACWGLALLLALWLMVGCAPPAPATEAVTPPGVSLPDSAAVLEAKVAQAPTRAIPVALTILHSNDVRGYVDPCG